MFMARNCRSKQRKSKINRFMAGNCRLKKKKRRKKPETFGGRQQSSSQPLGPGSPDAPRPYVLQTVIHSFPINLVQLSVDRLNSFPGSLSVGENPRNEVAFIDVDDLLKLQRFFSSWMTQSCYGLLETLEWHSITHH